MTAPAKEIPDASAKRSGKLRLAITEGSDFQNHRLRLHVARENAIEVIIASLGGDVSLWQPSLEIDFGLVFDDEAVSTIAQNAPEGFAGARIAGKSTLILKWKTAHVLVKKGADLAIRLRLPPIRVPAPRPCGTILLSLLEESTRVASGEYDIVI